MSTDAATPALLPVDSTLPDDPATLKRMILELLTQLRDQGRELSGLQHRLDQQLLRRLYGPKGEKFHPDQPGLFDLLAEVTAETAEPTSQPHAPPSAQPVESKPTKKGHGRRPLPRDLRRERLEHDVPEAEKICSCCQTLRVRIGEEVSEQLDYRPARLFVWEHVRLKYACPNCARAAAKPIDMTVSTAASAACTPAAIGSPVVVVAAKPAQPIDKGLPGPGLLAFVITSKYSDHLPLYRQEAILARLGVGIPRSTLCGWMAASAELLGPLYDAMLRDILLSRVVQTDETRLPVLDPDSDKTKAGRLWAFVGDRDHPHTVYHYTATKARDGPAGILKNYQGFLQADAANVFDGIYVPGAITEVGCWAHGRRYFHEARTSDAARSAEALARIGFFYDVEREAKKIVEEQGLDGEQADALRLQMRQERTLAKLGDFGDWLDVQKLQVLPKSPIAQAINYVQNHWQALLRFVERGFLNIDNNASERAMRPAALGRKNFLFAGSDNGGRTAAVLYTMTQTCRRHCIDPFAYLRDVLTHLPLVGEQELADFFPHPWAALQRAKVEPSI